MPYIITTTTRELTTPVGLWRGSVLEETSRRAVATLDEAWNVAGTGVSDLDLVRERFALEEHGRCTVGPLPDGTVIEVEQVGWTTLFTGWTIATDDHAGIISAYNAAQ